MRRLLIVLCVVLAGCTGTPVAPDTPTRTASPTQTASPTPTDAPTTPPPTPDDATDENTVDYADLSSDAQTAFDAAVDGEARFLPASPSVEGEYFDPDVLDEFRDVKYVTRDGTTYTLSRYSGDLYASYSIYADAVSPDEDASVVAYDDLSPNVSSQVRSAIENGSHAVPLGKWDSLHPDLDGVEYVRYDGETYAMSYAVGDYWVQVLEARPAE